MTSRTSWAGGRAAEPAADPAPTLPTGRGIELVLLAFAAVIVTGALVLVEANQEQELTRALLYVGAAYLGLFTVAHFAVRKFAPYADPLMLPCVALLNGLGLVMIHRLDLAAADRAVALGGGAHRADPAPGGVDGDRARAVRRRAVVRARPPHARPLRLHRGLRRAGPARAARPAAVVDLRGQRREDLAAAGHLLDPAGRVRQDPADRVLRRVPRAEARPVQPRPGAGSSAWSSRAPATSRRCWWPGGSRSACWCWSATSARRCCSSASCWCCSTRPPSGCRGWSSA